MAAPGSLKIFSDSFTQDVLFKGHQEAGLLGSRRSPWQKTVESIQASPWFGTGYGTSPSGEDPGLYLGKFSSTVEVRREHGTSYLEILEWVGLLGILPFVALLGYLGGKIGVTLWRLRISGDITHPSIPLILVLMSGAMHAGLEDWLFAVGYYLSVAFWVLAFVFVDLAPGAPVPERNGATWVPDVPRSFTGVAPMPQ